VKKERYCTPIGAQRFGFGTNFGVLVRKTTRFEIICNFEPKYQNTVELALWEEISSQQLKTVKKTSGKIPISLTLVGSEPFGRGTRSLAITDVDFQLSSNTSCSAQIQGVL
jgi:hypothetical protein